MAQSQIHENLPPNDLTHADRRRERIRSLNDSFRQGGVAEACVLVSAGVSALPWADRFALMRLVKEFDNFTHENDPHGEHDFGELEFKGARYFWKIDYYDRSLKAGSPDRADPSVTCRVLTVMLAAEY